jgi:hypothetical protein
MAEQDSQRGSFWTSLPGILTGAAALITAVSGLAIWHNNSSSQPAPQPASVVQQQTTQQQPASTPAAQPASQLQSASPVGSTTAEPGSQPWCAAKYKAWADEKAQTGVDDAGLRKEIVENHCNTKYGFRLGAIQRQ